MIKENHTDPILTSEEESRFIEVNNLFKGDLVSILGGNIVEVYMDLHMGKGIHDALEAEFRVFNVGSELYNIE